MDANLSKYRDIFDKKTFCYVATIGKDGAPQVTPVWCEFDGTHIVFNTARGRVKDKNLAKNPRVSVAAADPDNPYRYVQVRGRVAQITEQGADAHIDKMAKKYIGQDRYPWKKPDEVRMIVKILPERVQGMG
ncbi:MAG TPA: PPOX class F420-dependent oxidoreductase [Methylomirabilota bacterium]|jgi:PPOX class probable F420-dependent enzyme|nr:PPOX class F420-dependent oxidoreductase [Methylomirabilota bacterium]